MLNQLQNTNGDTHLATDDAEFLIFRLGQEEYGIDIDKVRETRGYDTVTPVVHAKGAIKGVINLRGSIVPIIDMRIKLEIGQPVFDQFTAVVLVDTRRGVAGMVVDDVSEVIALRLALIEKASPQAAELGQHHVIGRMKIEGRPLILADADALLSGPEFDAFLDACVNVMTIGTRFPEQAGRDRPDYARHTRKRISAMAMASRQREGGYGRIGK